MSLSKTRILNRVSKLRTKEGIKITLNNRKEIIEADSLTINELLKYKNYTFKFLVIKINGGLIKKDQYDSATIKDGDDVVVLHLTSGG